MSSRSRVGNDFGAVANVVCGGESHVIRVADNGHIVLGNHENIHWRRLEILAALSGITIGCLEWLREWRSGLGSADSGDLLHRRQTKAAYRKFNKESLLDWASAPTLVDRLRLFIMSAVREDFASVTGKQDGLMVFPSVSTTPSFYHVNFGHVLTPPQTACFVTVNWVWLHLRVARLTVVRDPAGDRRFVFDSNADGSVLHGVKQTGDATFDVSHFSPPGRRQKEFLCLPRQNWQLPDSVLPTIAHICPPPSGPSS